MAMHRLDNSMGRDIACCHVDTHTHCGPYQTPETISKAHKQNKKTNEPPSNRNMSKIRYEIFIESFGTRF